MARPFFELEPGQNASMTSAVSILPGAQLAVLNAAYRAAVARKRLRLALAAAAFLAALVVAAFGAEVNLRTLFTYFGNFISYFDRILTLEDGTRVWSNPAEWFWGWRKWLWMLAETILISYVGTMIGAVLAFALNFFAAQNTSPAPWLRFVIRRLLEFARTVPGIVFALIFVIAFGLGPMAGVLAIAIHSTGRAWKAVFRDRRKCRHEAGRRRALDRRKLAVLHAVCRVAAGGGRLRQLCAAALRDQRSRSLGDGLCGRRRHRAGTRGRDPKILLLRRQRDPADDHRHRLHHRYRAPAGCAAVCSAGMRGHEPVAEAGPGAIAGEISRCLRQARRVAPGHAGDDRRRLRRFHLRAGRSRLLAGKTVRRAEPARLDHADDDPARSGLVIAGLSLGAGGNPVDCAARHHHRRRCRRCRSACWRRGTSFPRGGCAFRCAASSIPSAVSIR